ncbi:ureidoglycolate hydrolase [Podospora fimiseda]|uniref:Ureidoglycolate hydrolase n=1 Tax=Podospora fimiseda TaxID=252190 RepID=A0AAN7BU46_9PEZI|nr:ureidoglycolate hydrolase [Podospora fimiseda]
MARIIQTEPLTRQSFAPFGDVIENPLPTLHPFTASTSSSPLPFDGISANQGSAIKYQHVSRQLNLYPQSPSGVPANSVMNIFVCAARVSIPSPSGPSTNPTTFNIRVLERHPYTTQTFIPQSNPLHPGKAKNYLVIVAPTLPPLPIDKKDFPVPEKLDSAEYPRPLPGAGMPDLSKLRAFVASSPQQAVTYGAGTWHAPMVTLGEKGEMLDFLVVQFANGVGIEDCQEVYYEGEQDEKVVAKVDALPDIVGSAKL